MTTHPHATSGALPDPREQEILRLLAGKPQLSVAELAERLTLSQATIRRDLASMEERGLIRRLHGGATLAGVARNEPFFSDKESLRLEGKRRIAASALECIADGDRIYLDGGSTVLQLARLLDRKRNLTIVTNSLSAAASLMDTEHKLVLVGGEFRGLSRTLVGPLTAPVINALHVATAFMGTIGFTLDDGMTTTDAGEAYTKSLIMSRADRVVLLADASKLGLCSFARSGTVEDIDLLISDNFPPGLAAELQRRGVQALTASADLI